MGIISLSPYPLSWTIGICRLILGLGCFYFHRFRKIVIIVLSLRDWSLFFICLGLVRVVRDFIIEGVELDWSIFTSWFIGFGIEACLLWNFSSILCRITL